LFEFVPLLRPFVSADTAEIDGNLCLQNLCTRCVLELM